MMSAQCRSDSLLLLSFLKVVVCGHHLVGLPLAVYETLKWPSLLPILVNAKIILVVTV